MEGASADVSSPGNSPTPSSSGSVASDDDSFDSTSPSTAPSLPTLQFSHLPAHVAHVSADKVAAYHMARNAPGPFIYSTTPPSMGPQAPPTPLHVSRHRLPPGPIEPPDSSPGGALKASAQPAVTPATAVAGLPAAGVAAAHAALLGAATALPRLQTLYLNDPNLTDG